MFALIHDGVVVQLAAAQFAVHPSLTWMACPDGTAIGDLFDGTAFTHPVAAAAAAVPRYVPLSTIRDRVTAAGKWDAFAAALDGLTADKRWHLLTLTAGVAPDDPDAVALLTALGCDPAQVLGP